MKKSLAALCLVVALTIPALAAWDLTTLNHHIDQTNFQVGSGCSGTLISVEERYILTANHCLGEYITKDKDVETYKDVPISQPMTNKGEKVGDITYIGTIVARDQKDDLALIQLKSEKIQSYLKIKLLPKNKVITRGEKVWLIGNPLGHYGSVTEGIVSSTERNNKGSRDVQFSGGIAWGNSGGMVLNGEGYLIGVAVRMDGISKGGYPFPAMHLGFASHIENVYKLLDKMCKTSVYDPAANDVECKKQDLSKPAG